MESTALVLAVSAFSAAVIAGMASIGAALGDSKAAPTALDAMARQPEMSQKLLVNLLISIGLIESIPIIASVIAIVLVFANPFVDLLK